jgi:secondary thiamine-phosphate synthase enzyme
MAWKRHFEHTVKTSRRSEFLDITGTVEHDIAESGVNEGICIVFVPHTTAGVTINENADPDVRTDMASFLERLVPKDPAFLHSEGNSDSHIKTTLTGPSLTLIVSGGKPVLGTWQAIYFAEFDGPRSRQYLVKVVEG